MTPARSSHFAVLRRPRRVWAVGAVHGAASRLAALHDALAERIEPGDHLVYLGNLVGRGDAIRETVDEILRFRLAFLGRPGAFACDLVCLRGSQEEMWQKLLQLQMAPNPREVLPWMLSQGVGATIEAYGGSIREGEAASRSGPVAITRWTSNLRRAVNESPGHAALFSAIRRAAYTDDAKMLFVNAGFDPARPLTAQGDSFWWGRGGFHDIARTVDGFARIVRGYDPSHGGVAVGAIAATIDGGCGFGGELAAACFDAAGALADQLSV